MTKKNWPLVEEANEMEEAFDLWCEIIAKEYSYTEKSKEQLKLLLQEAYRRGHGVGHIRAEHTMRLGYGIYREEGRL